MVAHAIFLNGNFHVRKNANVLLMRLAFELEIRVY